MTTKTVINDEQLARFSCPYTLIQLLAEKEVIGTKLINELVKGGLDPAMFPVDFGPAILSLLGFEKCDEELSAWYSETLKAHCEKINFRDKMDNNIRIVAHFYFALVARHNKMERSQRRSKPNLMKTQTQIAGTLPAKFSSNQKLALFLIEKELRGTKLISEFIRAGMNPALFSLNFGPAILSLMGFRKGGEDLSSWYEETLAAYVEKVDIHDLWDDQDITGGFYFELRRKKMQMEQCC